MTTIAQKAILILMLSSVVSLPAIAHTDVSDPGHNERYRNQAKRIHDRLVGVPPDNDTIDAMETAMHGDPSGKAAAELLIMDPDDPYFNPAFYNVTLKNWATPWTNEEQTVFAPLNDYTATVIGAVRDGIDFRKILYDDLIYVGTDGGAGYQTNNNVYYENLEDQDLSAVLQSAEQSIVTGLPYGATAGVMTSRAAAMAFFSDGTNRAMFRFTLMNHLCTDLEPLKDESRPTDRIRQDVSRSPGGDSRLYVNNCQGCHSGMDGMAGAYAYHQWDYSGDDKSTGQLTYTYGQVEPKHLINENNFKPGYITVDDSWVNYWRNGQNSLLGWNDSGASLDANDNAFGRGTRSLGRELAYSDAFAQCQVDKVFEALCLRDPDIYAVDRAARDNIVTNFRTSGPAPYGADGYDLRKAFTEVAAYCKGD